MKTAKKPGSSSDSRSHPRARVGKESTPTNGTSPPEGAELVVEVTETQITIEIEEDPGDDEDTKTVRRSDVFAALKKTQAQAQVNVKQTRMAFKRASDTNMFKKPPKLPPNGKK